MSVQGQVKLRSAFPDILGVYNGAWRHIYSQKDNAPPTLADGELKVKDDGTYISLRWRVGSNYRMMKLGRQTTASGTRGSIQYRPSLSNESFRIQDGSYWFSHKGIIDTLTLGGGDANLNFDVGAPLTITVKSDSTGYIRVIAVASDGTEEQMLPNAFEGDPVAVSAGVTYTYPPSGARYGFDVSPPTGVASIRVEFSTSSAFTTILDTAYVNFNIKGTARTLPTT